MWRGTVAKNRQLECCIELCARHADCQHMLQFRRCKRHSHCSQELVGKARARVSFNAIIAVSSRCGNGPESTAAVILPPQSRLYHCVVPVATHYVVTTIHWSYRDL
jgi:hypothetical protein